MKEVFGPIFIYSIVAFLFQLMLVYVFYRGIKRLEQRESRFFKGQGGSSSKQKEEEIKRLLLKEHQMKVESLEGKFRDKQLQLSSLLLKIKAITSTLDSMKIIKEIIDILKKDLGILKAVLFMRDERSEKLFVAETLGMELSEDEAGFGIPVDEINVITVSMEKRTIIASDAFHQDSRLGQTEVTNPLLLCKLSVPLLAEQHAVGAIGIHETSRELEGEDMRLLSAISTLTGMALSNASDLESSKRLSEEQLRERKRLETMFSKYVSPAVVDQLLVDPEMSALGGRRQKITLLFSDIRGFTRMSEQMSPEEIVELLNEYFSRMSDLILTYQGTLDKFMGDAIMALYGAPIIKMDDALRAVTTAVEMQQAVAEINGKRAARGQQTIQMGIGLNTGECVVGNVGSEKRFEYTAIGDAVNIASRLCSAAKGGQVLISESTLLELAEMIDVRTLEPITVKGKSEPLKIYEVLKIR